MLRLFARPAKSLNVRKLDILDAELGNSMFGARVTAAAVVPLINPGGDVFVWSGSGDIVTPESHW